MVGGMHGGRKGACVAGGMHDRGACMAWGCMAEGMCGRGVHGGGGV